MINLISCIILSFNSKYIYQSIDSVVEQNYEAIELIFADDGSNMYNKNKIENYINKKKSRNIKKIKYLFSKVNEGTVKNYNRALMSCSGEYIIVLAGDDVFYNDNIITEIVDKFIQTKADMLVCRRALCDNNKNIKRLVPTDKQIKKIKKLNTSKKQFNALILNDFFDMASGSVTYFSRTWLSIYKQFDEQYKLWEDGPMYIRYTKDGNIIKTAYDIVSIYYRNDDTKKEIHPALKRDVDLLHENLLKYDNLSFIQRIQLNATVCYDKSMNENEAIKRFFYLSKYFFIILIIKLRVNSRKKYAE